MLEREPDFNNTDIYLAWVAREANEAGKKVIFTERGTPIPVDQNIVDKIMGRIKKADF